MPRTRRTPASDTPAQDAAAVETPPVTSDSSLHSDPPSIADTPNQPKRPGDAPRAFRKPRRGRTPTAPTGEMPRSPPRAGAAAARRVSRSACRGDADCRETPAAPAVAGRRTADAGDAPAGEAACIRQQPEA